MELNVLKNVERKKNLLMFIVDVLVPIAALLFVMLFLNGTVRDVIVLVVSLAGVMIRLFEVKLGKFAKYLYVSIIPLFGTVVIVVGADGKFAAMTQAYFFVLLLSVGYYDISVVKVNAVVTFVFTIMGMIIFPNAFLQMHSWIVWIFIGIVYILAVAGAL